MILACTVLICKYSSVTDRRTDKRPNHGWCTKHSAIMHKKWPKLLIGCIMNPPACPAWAY